MSNVVFQKKKTAHEKNTIWHCREFYDLSYHVLNKFPKFGGNVIFFLFFANFAVLLSNKIGNKNQILIQNDNMPL